MTKTVKKTVTTINTIEVTTDSNLPKSKEEFIEGFKKSLEHSGWQYTGNNPFKSSLNPRVHSVLMRYLKNLNVEEPDDLVYWEEWFDELS
jgi:hypothetical protein